MPKQDNRHSRSKVTQKALMRAAEKLIADKGIENVSIRDIVSAAGQKNESALQYHFKNFSGLLTAIHDERSSETRARREVMLRELLDRHGTPDLRQLCTVMIQPAFDLACASVDFRRYVKAFGHELVLSDSSPLSKVHAHGAGGASGQQVGHLLRESLPHLNEAAYRRRMDAAVRLCSASMYHQARQPHAFRGDPAALFLHSLIDAVVGLLGAPVSAETAALAEKIQRNSK